MEQKTKYRIYTEYVHTRHVSEIVLKYFSFFSMFSGIGHYGDKKERCLVIENIDSGKKSVDVIAICREINTVNHQECCLITSEQVHTMLVAEKGQPVLKG